MSPVVQSIRGRSAAEGRGVCSSRLEAFKTCLDRTRPPARDRRPAPRLPRSGSTGGQPSPDPAAAYPECNRY